MNLRFRPSDDHDDRPVVEVRDVAEGAGVGTEETRVQLDRMRAESAFREPTVRRASPIPWIAGSALVFAVGVTGWRIWVANRTDPWVSARSRVAPQVQPPMTMRPMETTPLMTIVANPTIQPPSGMRVEVIGQRADVMADSLTGQRVPEPYAVALDRLAKVGEQLVETVAKDEAAHGAVAPANARYHGINGGIFEPRPGRVHLSMFGWAGDESEFIEVPLTAKSRAQIRELAERTLDETHQEQSNALAAVADPRQGRVTPPPGFTIEFIGRRVERVSGPKIWYSDIDGTARQARLFAAALNAAYRDRRPPEGEWSGDPKADAAIPLPPKSRIRILGPGGEWTLDVSTEDGALRAALRSLVDRIGGK